MRIEIPLLEDHTRPFIRISNGLGIIDTGSTVPMCGLSEEAMKAKFGAELLDSDQLVKGLGGKGENAKIYRFRHFSVGGLEFENIPFLSRDLSDFGVDFIISAGMFGRDNVITIDRRNNIFVAELPDITALSKKLWKCDADGWHMHEYVEGQGWKSLTFELPNN